MIFAYVAACIAGRCTETTSTPESTSCSTTWSRAQQIGLDMNRIDAGVCAAAMMSQQFAMKQRITDAGKRDARVVVNRELREDLLRHIKRKIRTSIFPEKKAG